MPSASPMTPVLDKKQQKKEKLRAQAIACGDWYIWIYVAYPAIILIISLATTLLDGLSEMSLAWIGLFLLSTDRNMLKHRDITPPHWGWIILGLPYIWKRCNILRKSKTPFWLATIVFALQGLILAFFTSSYLMVKDEIPSIVTGMLQAPSTPAPYLGATCVMLSGLKDFREDKLTCNLDNGEKVFINIITDDGETFVTWRPYNENLKTNTDIITPLTANKASSAPPLK